MLKIINVQDIKKKAKTSPKKEKKSNSHNIINYPFKSIVGCNTNVATHPVVEWFFVVGVNGITIIIWKCKIMVDCNISINNAKLKRQGLGKIGSNPIMIKLEYINM